MKGVSQIVLMLLILVIATFSISVLWSSFYDIFGKVASSGNTSTLSNALSSCMNIDSVKDDEVYLRNCGDGAVTNSSLRVYFDNAPVNFSMTSASLRKGEIGVITLYGLWNLSIGENYKLKITSPSGEVERFVKAVYSGNQTCQQSPFDGVLWLNFDEGSGSSTKDSSVYHNDGTFYGETFNDGTSYSGSTLTDLHTASGKYGNALQFDGVNDYVNVGNLNVNGTFTVETWAKVLDNNVRTVVGSRNSPNEYGFDFKFQNGNQIHGDIGNGTNWITSADASINYQLNTWYHIAYVVTPTNFTIYINGSQVASNSYSTNVPVLSDANHGLGIGAYGGYGGEYFNGTIDEVRIWGRALSQAEIQAEMQSSMPISRPVASYSFEESGNYVNDTHIWVKGKYGYGLSFDGSNDHLDILDSPSLRASKQVTLAAWVSFSNLSSSSLDYCLISKILGATIYNSYQMCYGPGYTLGGWVGNLSSPINFVNSPLWMPPLNEWHNLAYTFNDSSGTQRIYIDGLEVNNSTSNVKIQYDNGKLIIGADNDTGAYIFYLNGTMDEVKVWNRTLTADEIKSEYDGCGSSNLVASWSFDEGSGTTAHDSSSYHNDGTLQNIYPLDVIASNPSLEDPWHVYGQYDSDPNHITNVPQNWTSDTTFCNISTTTMIGSKETSIVKDGSSAFNMTFKSAGAYGSGCGFCLVSDPSEFPINESQYLEGGDFQYPIRGPSTYCDISFYFYNDSGFMCRRWASPLTTDAGGGWTLESYLWQPSSLSPYPKSACNTSNASFIPYIPQGAKYVLFQQFFVYQGSSQDLQAMFDKVFVYQWPSLPSNSSRIDRASSGWVDGMYGKAIRFDGYNDYINVSSSDSLNSPNTTNQITVEGWIYITNLSITIHTIAQKGADEHHGFWLGPDLRAGSPHRVWWEIGDGTTNYIQCLSGFSFSNNTWYHIAGTYDGSNMKVYVNGTQVGATCTKNINMVFDNSNLYVGGSTYASQYMADAVIDDVRIYNRALTQQEIQTVMQGGQIVTGGTTSLILGEIA